MSTERRGGRDPNSPGCARGRPAVATLRRRIGEQLSNTERVVDALSRDLARYRRDNAALTRERARLRENLAALEVVQLARGDAESLWRASVREQRGLAESLRQLEQEHGALVERCAALERELASERDHHLRAEAEVGCLEEQISELVAILGLLVPPRDRDDPTDLG